jgi:glycogen debranching enzyme
MVHAAAQRTGAAGRLRDIPDPPVGPAGGSVDPLRFHQTLAYDGWTVLLTGHDGSITSGGEGLWDLDCRILSRHQLRLGGQPLACLGSATVDGPRWSVMYLGARERGTAEGPELPQDRWSVTVDRRLGAGMRERIVIENQAMVEAATELSLEVGVDFADSLTRGRAGRRRGARSPTWRRTAARVVDKRGAVTGVVIRATARHGDRDDERGLRLTVTEGARPEIESDANGRASQTRRIRLRWPIRLPARGRWEIVLDYESFAEGGWRGPLDRPRRGALRDGWDTVRTRVDTPNSFVGLALDRAATDLLALRNWELEPSDDGSAWLPNAGMPWFSGLFGRDVLTTGWQAALLGPEPARGALDAVASTQGQAVRPETDEQPGRLIHELRRGPLSTLGLRPNGRYYGTQTTSSMFILALSEAWHWTGDIGLLRRHRATAVRAMTWAERLGDADRDGFLEYDGHAPGGLKNQGWKDSDEAIRYADGSIVPNPIATVEEQAFHYLALQRLAEILVALDEEPDEVERLLARAAALRRAWDAAFWMAEHAFYALALDDGKRQVTSITSNPIHALGAGIVPPDKARTVADRLLAEDLFSGWGIRTLSTEHPSYNPFAYHLGAVWPVEAATAALGFKRYGLDDHVERLVAGVFGAVAHCRDLRLPEALTGHDRAERDGPVAYPDGCSPQAWSASAVVQLIQTMLGIYPFAPAGVLALVRPRLPVWLPEVTIRGLRVGEATISLRFRRSSDGTTSHDVLEQRGHLVIVPAAPPDAVASEGLFEPILQWAVEHAPGRLGRALRIALGLDTVAGGGPP